MRVSAKADYALRAVIELAATAEGPVKGERIAQAQEIPLKFLENILGDLRHAGIVRSQRGVEGGWLARPAEEITVAEVIRRRPDCERPRRRARASRIRGLRGKAPLHAPDPARERPPPGSRARRGGPTPLAAWRRAVGGDLVPARSRAPAGLHGRPCCRRPRRDAQRDGRPRRRSRQDQPRPAI